MEERIPCSCSVDEITRALEATARAFDGAVKRTRSGDAWRMVAGTWLATNPNTTHWGLRVVREEAILVIRTETSVLPWTRAKLGRIADVRRRQFCRLLAEALAGRPISTLSPEEREPWGTGSTPEETCRSIAAVTLATTITMALVLCTLMIAGLQVTEQLLDELFARAEICEHVGYPALPSRAELDAFGTTDRVGAAFFFALPIAFFLGLLHAAIHAVGEWSTRIARMAPIATLLQIILCLLAFIPVLPWMKAVPCALLVPIASHVGTTLVWSRRKETLRGTPPPPPSRTRRITLALLVIAGIGLLAPWTHGTELLTTVALFRDQWLLTHAPGRAFAHAYYRYTLYAAEPLKRAYADPDEKAPYDRTVRTALVIGSHPRAAAELRRQDFVVEEQEHRPDRSPHDIVVETADITPKEIAALSDARFRGFWLLELSAAGWQAIYFVGAPFFLALLFGVLCVPLAYLYRVAPRATPRVILALLGIGVAAAILTVLSSSVRDVWPLKNASAEHIATALSDPRADVRHAAAVRAYDALRHRSWVPTPTLTQALTSAMADPDLRVRLWAAPAAGLTREESLRPALLAALDDPELLVRYRGAEGLGWLDAGKRSSAHAETLRQLEAMVRSASWYEASYALEALRRIDPEKW